MKKGIIVILLSVFILGAGGVYAVYSGYLKPNDIYIRKHDIIGCDVSHYQGEIDWETVNVFHGTEEQLEQLLLR